MLSALTSSMNFSINKCCKASQTVLKAKIALAYALLLKMLAKQPLVASLVSTSNSEYPEPLHL